MQVFPDGVYYEKFTTGTLTGIAVMESEMNTFKRHSSRSLHAQRRAPYHKNSQNSHGVNVQYVRNFVARCFIDQEV